MDSGHNLLGLVGWDSRSVDAVADTCDASSDDELGSGTASRRDTGDLDDDTNDHDTGTEEDALAATELVSKDEDEASTEETTDSVDGDDETFVGGITLDLGEGLDEGRGRDDTAHDTLIVTEEKKVCDGNNGDEDLKHAAGLAPVGGNAMFALFDAWGHGCSVSMGSWREVRRCWGGEQLGRGLEL
jgi:hypothetical protein